MAFKIHPYALIPLRETFVDAFPFLVFFLLFFLALFFLLKGKRINLWRRTAQVISFFLFVHFTQECFCFIRNAFLFGIPLIGKEELLSFQYLILLVFIISFTLVFGRIFCGWFCPFGFLQDAFFFFNKMIKKKLYMAILVATIVGATLYIIYLKPSQDILLQFIPNFLAVFLLLILLVHTVRPELEPKLQKIRFGVFFGWLVLSFSKVYTFQPWCYCFGAETGEYGILGALLMIIIVSLLFYRPYCRFICPVGVLLNYCSRKPLTVLKKEDCRDCSGCDEVCLSKNIDKGKIKDKAECILCGRCKEKDGFKISLR